MCDKIFFIIPADVYTKRSRSISKQINSKTTKEYNLVLCKVT